MLYKKTTVRQLLPLTVGLLSFLFSTEAKANCEVYFSSCPDKIILTDCGFKGKEPIDWPMPIAATTGGCVNFSMYQVSGPAPGSIVAAPASYVITYLAVAYDVLTNEESKAYCTFTVSIVADTEPPVILNCPPDITLYTGAGSTVNATWAEPSAQDNCSVKMSRISEFSCGEALPPGQHAVKYMAVDPSGNITYCYFTITVVAGFNKPVDPQAPTELSDSRSHEMETEPQPSFFLAPNPFNEVLAVNHDGKTTAEYIIRVMDMQGREISRQIWGSGANQILIRTEALPPGMIVVKIDSSDGAFHQVLRGVKLW